MQEKKNHKSLHIVSFDIPYPPNYGGVIDVFYKLKALAEKGVKIHLHAFQYGKKATSELNRYCASVTYYPRKRYKNPFSPGLPYIVRSRADAQLLENLTQDNHPVLFEGIHCCYYLGHPDLKGKKQIVRMHNLEDLYYKHLAKVEKNPLKRYYYNQEANKLRAFQNKLSCADHIASISPSEHHTLSLKHGNSFYLPVFHPHNEVQLPEGDGNFALYHGNLSVGENNQAALFLVNKVFNDLEIPLKIAGNGASTEIKRAAEEKAHIEIHENINPTEIQELIKGAHINILPCFQKTGIKLKLLNVLFNGRHCLVNNPMVENTGLEGLCHVENTPESLKNEVKALMQRPFKVTEAEKRAEKLQPFQPEKNAETLVSYLYD